MYQPWNFTWSPAGSAALLLAGHGGHILHALMTRQTTVWLPLCRAHLGRPRPSGLRLVLAVFVALMALGLAVIAAGVAWLASEGKVRAEAQAVARVSPAVIGVLLVIAVVAAAVGLMPYLRLYLRPRHRSPFRAVEITERGGITLTGVSEVLARALAHERRARRPEKWAELS